MVSPSLGGLEDRSETIDTRGEGIDGEVERGRSGGPARVSNRPMDPWQMIAEFFMGLVAHRHDEISWRQNMFDVRRSLRMHLQIVSTCGGHGAGMDFGNRVRTR